LTQSAPVDGARRVIIGGAQHHHRLGQELAARYDGVQYLVATASTSSGVSVSAQSTQNADVVVQTGDANRYREQVEPDLRTVAQNDRLNEMQTGSCAPCGNELSPISGFALAARHHRRQGNA
jgi:hypothetical protein